MGNPDDTSEPNIPNGDRITENTVKDLASQLEGVTVNSETHSRKTPRTRYGVGYNHVRAKSVEIPKKLKSILRNKKGKSNLTKQRKFVRFCEELSDVTSSCHELAHIVKKRPNSESSSRRNIIVADNESVEKHNDLRLVRSDSAAINTDSGVIQDDSGMIHSDSEVIQDDLEVIRNDSVVIQDNSAAIHGESVVIHNDSGVIQDDSGMIHNESVLIHDGSGVIHNDSRMKHDHVKELLTNLC